MAVELLISCVNKEPRELAEKMHLASHAVIVNQCDAETAAKCETETFQVAGGSVTALYRNERGVGRSRNLALEKSGQAICVFSDEDIVYVDDYAKRIEDEFAAHPEADILLFQVEVDPSRKTYQNDAFGPVSKWNCGRYPAYSMAFRRDKLLESGAKFSLLFGGGAPYSNGEDSLFIRDCLKAGLKAYKTPVCIGEEIPRPSTWFSGYHEKFFFDRGVLYHFLYGKAAKIWGFRFVFTKKKVMCTEIPWRKALRLLYDGIAKGKQIAKEQQNED